MRHILSAVLLLTLLAALLSGCAGAAPPPAESAEPTESVEALPPEPTEEPPALPARLALGFTLPSVVSDEELRWYFSPADEFDCGFCYPSYCSVWVEKGALRLSPSWFFARMFFTSVPRDAENAPRELLELLEPAKWGTVPSVGTAGTGWGALRALHLKYDTWRRWAAWETDERYCLLYGVCFDGREGEIGMIFDLISASYLTGAELRASAPESGELLRRDAGLSLSYESADLRGAAESCAAALRLNAANEGEAARELLVSAFSLDGAEQPLEAICRLEGGESAVWELSLPLTDGESGALCRTLELTVSAYGESGEFLFSLPVQIELNR